MTHRSDLLPRAVIAVAAASSAVLAVQTSLASWLRNDRPSLAARIAPSDARSAAEAARQAIAGSADIRSPAVTKLIAAALARDAALVPAIELRALQFEAAGDGDRAGRLFDLSDSISRRSLPTRLWLIQRSVDRGDVAGALANFDIALRTSKAAPDLLFPVLAGATTDPALVGPIARLLDRPSDWRAMFLHHAMTRGGNAANIGEVVLRMRDRAAVTDHKLDQVLIGQLVSQAEFRVARRVHDAFMRGLGRRALVSDPDFADPNAPYPFGWGLSDRNEAIAVRDLVNGRPVLSYRAPPGRDGQVAAQLLMLSPGRYQLSAISMTAPADPAAPPVWTVTCGQRGGPQIALMEQRGDAGTRAMAEFRVPPNCEAQWLALHLRPSDVPGGQSGAIATVSIVRR